MILNGIASRLNAAVLALVVFAVAPCRAGLVVEVESVSSYPGASGSFDINLINTDATTSYFVSTDFVQVELAGVPGVVFTDATIGTAATYLFALSGTTGPPASPLSLDAFPTTTFTATDAEFAGPDFYREVGPGAKFGLVHVEYWIDPSTPFGLGSISIVVSGTSFSDVDGGLLEFSTVDGTFAVAPEPSTLLASATSLAGLAALGLRRRPGRKGRLGS